MNTRPSAVPFDTRVALQRVMELMAIPGDSGHEAEVVDYLVAHLRSAGAKAAWISTDQVQKRTPIQGNTGNLICVLPGTVKGPRRLLMSHMDTVPICVGSQPVRRGNRVTSSNPESGLGADNRAGCAVTLTTACEILSRGLDHPPLTFLWTVQEEIGLHGARLLPKGQLKAPKLCFNWDGGAAHKLTIGATGGYRMEIRITGLASHAGGAPEAGVSAIAIAGLAIADLQRRGWHGAIKKRGKLGTSNIGVIRGGAATNVVCDEVTLRAEARSHDREFREEIVHEIEAAFHAAASKVTNIEGHCGQVEFCGNLDYEAFRIPMADPCVIAAQQAVELAGLKPEFAIANGGLDANWLSARGLPTVSLGCGQVNQHMKTEELLVDAYLDACQIGLILGTATESESGD
jgi:tripeptide aminopeptidase